MTTVFDALAAAIDDLAPRHGVPGVAAAVFDADGTEFHSFGEPVIGDGRAVTPDTLFQIGSVSKPIAALIVHALIADGRFGLDDTIGSILGRDDLPPATIRHLLGHQAGIEGDILLTNPPTVADTATAVDVIANGPRLGEVGGEPSYSNAGYSLLGAAIEATTGESFAANLRSLVTRPLRMRRTVTTADEAISQVVALPHQSHGADADLIPGGAGWQPRWELSPVDGAPAGVISSVSDLARFGRYVLGLDSPARAPLTVERLPALWAAQARFGPAEWSGGGFLVDRSRHVEVVHHPGVTAGYGSRLTLIPERSWGVAVLTNATAGGRLADEVTSAALDAAGITLTGVEEADTPAAMTVADLAGRYVGGLGITIAEPIDDDRITLSHEPHGDGRWQPFPDEPWTGRLGDGALVGIDDDLVVPVGIDDDLVVPVGIDDDLVVPVGIGGAVADPGGTEPGRAWIRWNRRLRVRTRP